MPYKDPAAKKAHQRAYYLANKERLMARTKEYYEANKEEALAKHKAHYLQVRETRSAQMSSYKKANRGILNALGAKRRAAQLNRTPSWADLGAIREFYETRLEGEHVDHIIPLQGDLVSGLHVEYNLQHLDGSENCSKKNAFDPWTYVHILPGE